MYTQNFVYGKLTIRRTISDLRPDRYERLVKRAMEEFIKKDNQRIAILVMSIDPTCPSVPLIIESIQKTIDSAIEGISLNKDNISMYTHIRYDFNQVKETIRECQKTYDPDIIVIIGYLYWVKGLKNSDREQLSEYQELFGITTQKPIQLFLLDH